VDLVVDAAVDAAEETVVDSAVDAAEATAVDSEAEATVADSGAEDAVRFTLCNTFSY
jgi:hypothetical protein